MLKFISPLIVVEDMARSWQFYEQLLGQKAHNGELYFDADDIESTYQRLQAAGVDFIEGIQEQPWGQRAMRLYDPDGHIIEIGEPMDITVRRFYGQGWSIERIAEKTGMPREFIKGAIKDLT